MDITIGFLRYHWGDRYEFEIRDRQYTATAKFGGADVLTASTAVELRAQLWKHYPGLLTERRST
jgi:hypothetical protein